MRARSLLSLFLIAFGTACGVSAAQEPPPASEPAAAAQTAPAAEQADSDADADAGVPDIAHRGDRPVTPEAVLNTEASKPPPAAAEASTPKTPPTTTKPGKTEPSKTEPKVQAPAPLAPLVIWANAGWAAALGGARCGAQGLEGADTAIRVASTLQRSAAIGGLGVASAGALGDHPLFAYAAHEQPERLAELIASAGFSVLAVGVADLNGPLLREPQLTQALNAHGVKVVASNLVCNGQTFCAGWDTAEDPLTIVERGGRRYAFMSVLPDDVLARVEPAGGRPLQLTAAADALVARTEEALRAGAELVIANIDHGADATASVNLANFLAQLPPNTRPDLMLSPSSGENLLFLRPLDVAPAVVGTRAGVLMGIRVTKLPDSRDTDVFARSVRQDDWSDSVAAQVQQLGASYCAARGEALAGGDLAAPLSNEDFVELAGAAARELADADLALVDPHDYDSTFAVNKPRRLQRAQVERAVLLDSPLVYANVTLDWLGNLRKALDGLRPLVLVGATVDNGDNLIAGRIPVTGAMYRIVTTSVIARSGRIPNGISWTPVDTPSATLRGALLAHLDVDDPRDPRSRLRDPMLGTQWILRTDGQIQTNLTEVGGPAYDEPALKVNDSFQVGARLLLNLDADAPRFLFENALQLALDRNLTTKTTAQDLAFLQTVYTYRGLWPTPFWYPHPFAEGYAESQFLHRHLLLRPKLGFRSMANRVLSLKVFGGLQYEVFDADSQVFGGVGAELLLKPWTIPLSNGVMQIEGNLTYYWNAPGLRNEHALRGQFIGSFQLIGPLQFTLTALAAMRKDPETPRGAGIAIQAGLRLRFVSRSMSD